MQKIEYSDINKFLVSIGMILILISFLIPFSLLKFDFGLVIANATYSSLYEPVKEIIDTKIELLTFAKKISLYVSAIFLLLGVISFSLGITRWFQRQKKVDEKFDKEILVLDKELDTQSLSPDETDSKVKDEVTRIEVEEYIETQKAKTNTEKFKKYLQIENDIINRFKYCGNQSFEYLPQQKLENKFDVDLYIKSKTKNRQEAIVEVKYFNNKILWPILRNSMWELAKIVTFLKKTKGKDIAPVFIVVTNPNAIDPERLEYYKKKCMDESVRVDGLEKIIIRLVSEKEIDKFESGSVLKLL